MIRERVLTLIYLKIILLFPRVLRSLFLSQERIHKPPKSQRITSSTGILGRADRRRARGLSCGARSLCMGLSSPPRECIGPRARPGLFGAGRSLPAKTGPRPASCRRPAPMRWTQHGASPGWARVGGARKPRLTLWPAPATGSFGRSTNRSLTRPPDSRRAPSRCRGSHRPPTCQRFRVCNVIHRRQTERDRPTAG